MSRKAPPAAVLADTPDEVEARFYEALQRADIAQLMAVWADDDEIVCVHPGGTRVIGPAAIRASFEAIFANGGIPVKPEQVHRLQQLGSALHHLVERIQVAGTGAAAVQTAFVLASNFYVKTANGWRLGAHHASAGLPDDLAMHGGHPGAASRSSAGPSTLH